MLSCSPKPQLSAAAKAAGARLGYRVLVTAVDIPPQEEGRPSPLLGPDEALVLPDLIAIGPLNADTAKRYVPHWCPHFCTRQRVSAPLIRVATPPGYETSTPWIRVTKSHALKVTVF